MSDKTGSTVTFANGTKLHVLKSPHTTPLLKSIAREYRAMIDADPIAAVLVYIGSDGEIYHHVEVEGNISHINAQLAMGLEMARDEIKNECFDGEIYLGDEDGRE